jgi:hypothetical protein
VRLRLAVLGILVLTAAAILVVFLHSASGPPAAPGEGAAKDPGEALGVPPIVAEKDRDDAPPRLYGGGRSDASLDPLKEGLVLLVFADPREPGGLDTARVAVDLHRRLRDRRARVVLVVPRESLPSEPADPDSLAQALRRLGVATDVKVLLDASDADGSGALRRTAFGVAESTAAVLFEDGVETWRVTPATPGAALDGRSFAAAVNRLRSAPPIGPPAGDR